MSNYTSQELRTCADAVDAEEAGKPGEQMHPSLTIGKWIPLDKCGIGISNGWRYRPAPAPEVIPWTRETLPTLPVEVVSKDTGSRHIVASAYQDEVLVSGIGGVTYLSLQTTFTRHDNSPCGEVKA